MGEPAIVEGHEPLCEGEARWSACNVTGKLRCSYREMSACDGENRHHWRIERRVCHRGRGLEGSSSSELGEEQRRMSPERNGGTRLPAQRCPRRHNQSSLQQSPGLGVTVSSSNCNAINNSPFIIRTVATVVVTRFLEVCVVASLCRAASRARVGPVESFPLSWCLPSWDPPYTEPT